MKPQLQPRSIFVLRHAHDFCVAWASSQVSSLATTAVPRALLTQEPDAISNHSNSGEGSRAAIRSAVSSIASGLLEHRLQLIGYNGQVTTWGQYDPDYLKNSEPNERALNSVELLSHLRVAYEITGESKFLDAYRRIGTELGYVQNIAGIPEENPQEVN